MKKSELKQIIKEELRKVLKESEESDQNLISEPTISDIREIQDVKIKYPKAYRFYIDVFTNKRSEIYFDILDSLLSGDDVKESDAINAFTWLEKNL